MGSCENEVFGDESSAAMSGLFGNIKEGKGSYWTVEQFFELSALNAEKLLIVEDNLVCVAGWLISHSQIKRINFKLCY